MNKFLSKLTPEWALRAGLGIMYMYSGIDIVRHPTAWFWAIRPVFKWFPEGMRATFTQPDFMKSFLISQGIVEIIFALVLLAWFLSKKFAKYVAGLTALEMAAILFLIPIDAVTFRDFGLLGGALALFLILNEGYKETISNSRPMMQNKIEQKTIKEGLPGQAGEPLVQTFDEFIGNQK